MLQGNTEEASQAERETDLLRTTVATISRSAGKFNYLSTIMLIKSFFWSKQQNHPESAALPM